jgi:hypothetical protein
LGVFVDDAGVRFVFCGVDRGAEEIFFGEGTKSAVSTSSDSSRLVLRALFFVTESFAVGCC